MRPIVLALVAALTACAPRALAAHQTPARWGGHTLELVDERGRVLPTFEHLGRTHVLGVLGQRYLIRIRNGSGRRVEVVASVDGRDVVDGRPASFEKRGYVIAPYGEVIIDGYRLSQADVAAFRFSNVPRSYAARKGDARDVGVVGVAVFQERQPYLARPHSPPHPPPHPYEPYPSDRGLAPGERSEAESPPADVGAEPPATAQGAAPRSQGEGHGAHRYAPQHHRPGLGTEFGEQHASYVEQVPFERASPRPDAVLTLRYDDRPGLVALGIDVDGGRWARSREAWLRATATPFRSEPGYCEPPAAWHAQ